MTFRILASIALLFSILFMPFWVSIIIGLAGMVYFSFYWEATLLFLLSDLLWGTEEVKFFGAIFISFIVAIIVLIIIEITKKNLNFTFNKK